MTRNLSSGPALPAKAPELGVERTGKAAGATTRHERIAREERMALLREMFHRLEWTAEFDYKRERTRT